MSRSHGLLKQARFLLEHAGVSLLSLSVRWLSAGNIVRLGRFVGDVAYRLSGRRVRTALTNLDIAFADSKTPAEKKRIVKQSFRHFCVAALQCLWLQHDTKRRAAALIEGPPKGLELLQASLKRGNGVFFLIAHYGNWEVPGIHNGFLGICPLHFIVRRLDNPYLEERVRRFRSVSGNGIFYRDESPFKIVRALKNNACVAVMMDQNTARDGLFVNFFGKKAATPRSLAVLSLKLDTPILPMFSHPTEKGTYCVELGPLIEAETTGDKEKDVLSWTQACESFLESVIRARPEPWMWFHRRWKTRPAEERNDPVYRN